MSDFREHAEIICEQQPVHTLGRERPFLDVAPNGRFVQGARSGEGRPDEWTCGAAKVGNEPKRDLSKCVMASGGGCILDHLKTV